MCPLLFSWQTVTALLEKTDCLYNLRKSHDQSFKAKPPDQQADCERWNFMVYIFPIWVAFIKMNKDFKTLVKLRFFFIGQEFVFIVF